MPITNDCLSAHGLDYNPVFGLLGCTQHDSIIPHPIPVAPVISGLVKHLHGTHGLDNQQATAAALVVYEHCTTFTKFVFPQSDPIKQDYIEGIPHLRYRQGHTCAKAGCGYTGARPNTGRILRHTCLHGGNGSTDVVPCWYQSLPLANGIGSYNFPVTAPPPASIEFGSKSHQLSFISQHIRPVIHTGDSHVTHRDVSPLLRHFGWDQIVKGMSEDAIASVSTFSVDKDGSGLGWEKIQKTLEGFFSRVNRSLPGKHGIGQKLVAAGSLSGDETSMV